MGDRRTGARQAEKAQSRYGPRSHVRYDCGDSMPPRPQLVIQTDQAAIDARETYTVTDGTFAKGDVAIGPAGIGRSPEGGMHVSRYAIEEFEMGDILGKGASCVCRRAIHRA